MRRLATPVTFLFLSLTLMAAPGCSTPGGQGASIHIPRGATVVLYSRSGCSYCSQTKEYLAARKIDVEERNISTDQQAVRELARLYEGKLKGERQLVPVLLVGERIVVGFDEEELAEALAAWKQTR